MQNKAYQNESKHNDQEESETESSDQSESQLVKDEFPGYSDEIKSKLNKLAKGLIAGGREIECTELYSTEKLFKFLDIHETAFRRWRNYFPVTGYSSSKSQHHRSIQIQGRLRFSSEMFTLSIYTMDYLKYACEYRDTLAQVLPQIPITIPVPKTTFNRQ
ncbi:hypothetical protein LXL04_035241 [Taraxacum kok-saghyz]